MTPDQASDLMGLLRVRLHERQLDGVITEIDRLIAEGVEDQASTFIDDEGYVKIRPGNRQQDQVRRRRAGPIEGLQIAMRLLHERLVVVPTLAKAVEKRLGSSAVVWRPDPDFVQNDEQVKLQTFDLQHLRTDSAPEMERAFKPLLPVMTAPSAVDIEEG